MHTSSQKSIDNCSKLCSLIKISLLFLLILTVFSCRNRTEGNKNDITVGKADVLKLLPETNNPRNSEGDFITLKDERILFIYSHYTGESGSDHGNAYLAGRFSEDK